MLFKDLPSSPSSPSFGDEQPFLQRQKEQLKQKFRDIRDEVFDFAGDLKIEAVRLYDETRVLLERGKFLRDLFGEKYKDVVEKKVFEDDDFEKLKGIFGERLNGNFNYLGLRITHEGVFILWLSPNKKIESQSLGKIFNKAKLSRIARFMNHDLTRKLESMQFIGNSIIPYIKKGDKNWNAEIFWRSEMVNEELIPMLIEVAENGEKFTFRPINGGFVLSNKKLGDFKFLRKDYDSNFNFIRPKVDTPDFNKEDPSKPISLRPQYFQREREHLTEVINKYSDTTDDLRDSDATRVVSFLSSASDDELAEFEYELGLVINSLVGHDKKLLKTTHTIEDESKLYTGNVDYRHLNPYNVSISNFESVGEGSREKMLMLNRAFEMKALIYDQRRTREAR